MCFQGIRNHLDAQVFFNVTYRARAVCEMFGNYGFLNLRNAPLLRHNGSTKWQADTQGPPGRTAPAWLLCLAEGIQTGFALCLWDFGQEFLGLADE